MLARESRVSEGLFVGVGWGGGREFAPAGTWHVAIWHRPVIYITYIGTLSHVGHNVFILVSYLDCIAQRIQGHIRRVYTSYRSFRAQV